MKPRYKIIIFIFIVFIVLAGLLIRVQRTNADITSFAGCTAGGIIAPWLSNKISEELNKAIEAIAGWFGISTDLEEVLKVPVLDKAFMNRFTSKEYRADVIARCAARELFGTMTASMVNKARTMGRNGGVTFITNWRNFQTQAEYRGENVFRAMLSNTNVCGYMSSGIKGIFNATTRTLLSGVNTRTGSLEPFNLQANCTLPSNFNMANYQSDFINNGGWEAFDRLMEPQNNYYGLLMMSLNEMDKQRSLEQSTDVNQALAGKGLLGISGTSASDSCALRASNGDCIKYKDIKTPGSYISDTLAATVQQELAWVTSVDELNELIADMSQVLINRLMNLGNSNEGQGVLVTPIQEPEPPPPPPGSGSGSDSGTGNYTCADPGNSTPNYQADVSSAIDAVKSANPNGIVDQRNTSINSLVFVDYVAAELQNSGYSATADVLNGHDNESSGDLIAVWRSGDSTIERYDIILGVGEGSVPLSYAAGLQGFSGDIPLSCASGGGGGGGTPPSSGLSGNIRSDFSTCTKGTISTLPNCDVVLNYTTTNAIAAEIKKDGSAWRTTSDIGTNVPAGTQVDANPTPGTHIYSLYGYADGSSTETLLSSVTVTIQ